MEIEFYTKSVYGEDKMYVKDTEMATKLRSILGTITVSNRQMNDLTDAFGVTWKEVLAPKKD